MTTQQEKQETVEEKDGVQVRKRPSAEPAAPEAPASEEATAVEAQSAEATEEAPAAVVESAAPRRRVVDVSSPVEAPAAPVVEETPADAAEQEAAYAAQEAEFAAMMDATGSAPEARQDSVQEGDKVEGKVVLVGEENVFVDLGIKTEGYISVAELKDKEGNLSVAVGDTIDAYVVKKSSAGIELARSLRQGGDTEALEQAFASGIPVEGKVTGTNKGGYEVSVSGKRAFCPMSQIDIDFTPDPDAHVGQTYQFRITRCEVQGKNLNLVVSRSELMKEDRAAAAAETFSKLEKGQVLEGTVRRLAPFGAFVDLGGVDGLVHVSELSWTRVDNPGDLVSVGDKLKVKVLDLQNMAAGPEKARISLSVRAVAANPWERVGTDFVEGEVYEGEVLRVEHYGAFVQLEPGIDGLVHVSEFSLERVTKPREFVTPGQTVKVQIKSIDQGRQRISLSMKALQGDPWDTINDRYSEEMSIEGTIENIENFGVFVSLEPGLTGLIPLSELATERGRDPHMDFRKGDTVSAQILSIDPARRRLTLTRKSKEERSQEAPREDRRPRRNDGGGNKGGKRRGGNKGGNSYRENTGMGTFADLFPAKLRRSNNRK